MREKLFTFQIQDTDNVDKSEFMSSLAKNIANSFCRTDYVSETSGYAADMLMMIDFLICASYPDRFSKRLQLLVCI